jgi:hypothetical protein
MWNEMWGPALWSNCPVFTAASKSPNIPAKYILNEQSHSELNVRSSLVKQLPSLHSGIEESQHSCKIYLEWSEPFRTECQAQPSETAALSSQQHQRVLPFLRSISEMSRAIFSIMVSPVIFRKLHWILALLNCLLLIPTCTLFVNKQCHMAPNIIRICSESVFRVI